MNLDALFASLSPRAAILMAAGGVIVLGGCDRSDPVAEALQEGRRELALVAHGPEIPAPQRANEEVLGDLPDDVDPDSDVLAKARTARYEQTIRSLGEAAKSGTPGEQAAAELLIARARIGIAIDATNEATRLERQARRDQHFLRAEALAWSDAMASARARESFDPADDIQSIDGQIADLDAQTQETRAQRESLQGKVDALDQEIERLTDEARSHRVAAAEIRQQASPRGADEAIPLLEQAHARARQGDRLDVEAGSLQARIDTLAPELAELDLRLEMYAEQRSLLGASRQRTMNRDSLLKEAAAQARADAAEAAQRLRERTQALHQLRTGQLAQAIEAAVSAYESAAAAALKARPVARDQAGLLAGEAHQAIGDLHLASARSLAHYASLLERVAAYEGLDSGRFYAQRAQEAAVMEREALAASNEAFTRAREFYDSADPGDSRLTQTKARMDELIALTGGAARDAEVGAEDGMENDPVDDAGQVPQDG